jgi:hypothetical protein
VEEARWDDTESKWRTSVVISGQKDSEFSSSYVLNSDFLVSAVGQLNLPRAPDISGLADFQGKMMHSARWDWSYDMTGKRIAIIGNGAHLRKRQRAHPQACILTQLQEQLLPRSPLKLLGLHLISLSISGRQTGSFHA